MKTAIFTGDGPAVSWTRLSLRCAIAMAVLAASNLFGGPVVKTLGGGTSSHYYGYLDGETLQALFHTPMGIAADEDGDLYVADYGNNAIRELYDFSGTGNGSTLTWVTNHINSPVGVAVDANENLFVLNRGSTTALSTNGTVLEFDAYGILVATNATHLTNATAIAIDFNDNIYVTERTNLLIEITPTNQTTLATITAPGALLEGISILPNGNIAACDFGRDGILTINPTTEIITTNAGFNGPGDGTGPNNVGIPNSLAKFLHPFGVAAAGDGTLIVSDYGNDRVKVITVAGVTTNLYGVSSNDWDSSYYPGWADGTVVVPDAKDGVASRCPVGVSLSGDGSTVYTSEDYYHIIRQTTGAAFAPFETPPGAPPGLTATVITNAGNLEVTLTWSPVTIGDVTNYLVERSTSTNSYTIIGQTTGTAFTDTGAVGGLVDGAKYFYIIQAENAGGESGNSAPASVTIPVPAPPAPNIGSYDFEGSVVDGFYSVMHIVSPGNPYVIHNPVSLAIDPTTNGVATYYITSPPYSVNATAAFIVTNGSTPPVYENNQLYGSPNVNSLPPLPLTNGLVTVEAVNVNGVGEVSAVTSASFEYEIASPTISSPNGGQLNAAQFTVSDVSSNVTFYYTLDGSNPTNAPASQQVYTTNGVMTLSLNGSTNIYFSVLAIGNGPESAYTMSGIASWVFTPDTFVPNTISWGFAQGECSSAFIAAAGQTFYAPVTLTMLPKAVLYSLQFNMTVGNSGAGITNAAPSGATPLGFQSMLMTPIPGTTPPVFEPIPPWVFAAEFPNLEGSTNLPPADYVTNYSDGQVFVNLETSNGNELAVGWVERAGFTNLYPTTSQTLIQYSQAHDDLFPDAAVNEPNGVIVGAYSFNVSPNAANGEQYQVQINQASGTADGIGAPGESVDIYSPNETNAGSLGPGTLNAIKNITIGSIPYLVGNVYPFSWFNAGDFGNSNLQNADVLQVFEAAVYQVNVPVYDTNSFNVWTGVGYTNVSDMYDAMDSCGSLGVFDNNPGDEFYGYYTNAGPTNVVALLSGSFTNINQMAFGDGQLDICDVYVTFLRSEFTNQMVWFQRLWTNGVRVATASYAPGIISAATTINSGGGKLKSAPAFSSPAAPVSITNTPLIHFTSTNFVASAGQTVTVPINATVFGSYPARMMLLNVSVVPLDGSPALTVPVQFTPSSSLSTAFGSSTPWASDSSGNGNYSAVWFPTSLNPVPGFTNTANIGMLTVTIPTNATSLSSYAIHFDKASASPSGLVAFPEKTITGLITLSSRTSSYYNDGIPDSWRLRYFGTIYNELSVSNADADGTGMNNWQKYSAGLDPTDPTSVLNEGTDQKMAQNTQDLVLYWPTVNGQTYLIQRSTSLFPPQWTTISTNIGDGTYMEIHDTSGGNKRYYQVITQ